MLDPQALETGIFSAAGCLQNGIVSLSQGHNVGQVFLEKRQQFSIAPDSTDVEWVVGSTSLSKHLFELFNVKI